MNKISFNKRVFFVYLCIIGFSTFARENDESEQLKIGNFAVQGTMQPFPFFGFGENIIEEGDLLGCVFPTWLVGKNERFADMFPYIVYGVRDDFSLLLGFPTALSYRQGHYHSSGSGDLILQGEYALYIKQKEKYTNEITIVGSVILPTGNEEKLPPTGLGSPTIFLGFTASHLATKWYFYTSGGTYFTPQYNHIKVGNRFLYEWGVGKNIAYKVDKWVLMWMVEFLGSYSQKSKTNGIRDENSSFNRIFFGPSLFFSTQRIILQAGIAPTIYHNHSEEQSRSSFLAGISLCCKFN